VHSNEHWNAPPTVAYPAESGRLHSASVSAAWTVASASVGESGSGSASTDGGNGGSAGASLACLNQRNTGDAWRQLRAALHGVRSAAARQSTDMK
jgi:hypothetical protein